MSKIVPKRGHLYWIVGSDKFLHLVRCKDSGDDYVVFRFYDMGYKHSGYKMADAMDAIKCEATDSWWRRLWRWCFEAKEEEPAWPFSDATSDYFPEEAKL